MADEYSDIGQALYNEGTDILTNEYINELRPSVEEVVLSAENLKAYATANQVALEHMSNIIKPQQDQDALSVVNNFNKEIEVLKKDYLNLMTLVLDFQNKVNEFMGQKVKLVFVYMSKTQGAKVFTYENGIKDITPSFRDSNIRGRIKVSQKDGLKGFDKDDEIYQEINRVFKEVYNRMLISKSKIKLGGRFFIFWKEDNDTWDGRIIDNQGVLAEAFIAFFVHQYKFSNYIEKSVEQYILDSNFGAIAVDNASGFLQGDVSNGIFQYAVKSAGASAMSYKEIINYADEVIQNQGNLQNYLDGLKQRLDAQSIDGYSVHETSTFVRDNAEELMESIIDQLNKSGKGDITATYL